MDKCKCTWRVYDFFCQLFHRLSYIHNSILAHFISDCTWQSSSQNQGHTPNCLPNGQVHWVVFNMSGAAARRGCIWVRHITVERSIGPAIALQIDARWKSAKWRSKQASSRVETLTRLLKRSLPVLRFPHPPKHLHGALDGLLETPHTVHLDEPNLDHEVHRQLDIWLYDCNGRCNHDRSNGRWYEAVGRCCHVHKSML